jgi:hypothetical protein
MIEKQSICKETNIVHQMQRQDKDHDEDNKQSNCNEIHNILSIKYKYNDHESDRRKSTL